MPELANRELIILYNLKLYKVVNRLLFEFGYEIIYSSTVTLLEL